MMMVVV